MVDNMWLLLYAPVQYNLEFLERVAKISPCELLDCIWIHVASRPEMLEKNCPRFASSTLVYNLFN